MPVRFTLALVLFAAALAGCSDDSEPDPPAAQPETTAEVSDDASPLERAQTRWAESGPESYAFKLEVVCFCPDGGKTVEITVRDGVATGLEDRNDFRTSYDTVPEMFQRIEKTENDPAAGRIEVTYDPELGYPTDVSLDQIENAIDDEVSWTVRDFKAL